MVFVIYWLIGRWSSVRIIRIWRILCTPFPNVFAAGEGTVVYKGRNELRKMTYGGLDLVVKSFHRPNLINRFVYGVFRPSKAKRSYDHARMYQEIGVGTPLRSVILMYAKDCFSTVVIM